MPVGTGDLLGNLMVFWPESTGEMSFREDVRDPRLRTLMGQVGDSNSWDHDSWRRRNNAGYTNQRRKGSISIRYGFVHRLTGRM